MDWGNEVSVVTNNFSLNLITISSLGMGMVTMGIGKNYYEAGKDFALLINAVIQE